MLPETVFLRLADFDNIVAIKRNVGDIVFKPCKLKG
jgi:dihydrodipicolinate synthase/N-acetylneuraminate lyase